MNILLGQKLYKINMKVCDILFLLKKLIYKYVLRAEQINNDTDFNVFINKSFFILISINL